METLQELKELANSLDYFDLEPDEQELLDEIDAITIFTGGPELWITRLWIHEPGGPYVTTLKADTRQGLEQQIIDHYKNTITQLTKNK